MRLVLDRDAHDHMRFCPIQSKLGQQICSQYGMPVDLSTAVLVDAEGAHKASTAVLRLFRWMGFPYNWLGGAALLVPLFIRDGAYSLFARNRGAIWRRVKWVMGWGDTSLVEYKDRILGLEDPVDKGWGFGQQTQPRSSRL